MKRPVKLKSQYQNSVTLNKNDVVRRRQELANLIGGWLARNWLERRQAANTNTSSNTDSTKERI